MKDASKKNRGITLEDIAVLDLVVVDRAITDMSGKYKGWGNPRSKR
jgi:hypothetical protein